jgi:hypothetical protein
MKECVDERTEIERINELSWADVRTILPWHEMDVLFNVQAKD